MLGRWLLGLITFTLLSTVIYCGDSRGETLESLLVELRKLREVQRQESIQARNEFRHLERLRKQKSNTLNEHKSSLKDLEDRVQVKSQAVDKLKSSASDLEKQTDALRTSLIKLLDTLSEAQNANPILTDASTRKRIESLKKTSHESTVDTLTTNVISLVLELSSKVTTCEVATQSILLGKTELHVQTLRIGSVAKLWITRDRKRCGLGVPANGNVVWQELPDTELKVVTRVFAVANEDTPAEVILVPLPAGAQK